MADPQDMAVQMARLEERMKTMQAEYETGLERIAGDHKAALESMERRMTERDLQSAQRDKANIQWFAGMIFGAAVLIIAVIGLMIRFDG